MSTLQTLFGLEEMRVFVLIRRGLQVTVHSVRRTGGGGGHCKSEMMENKFRLQAREKRKLWEVSLVEALKSVCDKHRQEM